MSQENQFMVDFTLPSPMSEEFLRLIPLQRSKVSQFFREGRLVNYALSIDKSKMWAVVSANNEDEVLEFLEKLPLTRFMRYKVSLLTFYNAVNSETPAFSMN